MSAVKILGGEAEVRSRIEAALSARKVEVASAENLEEIASALVVIVAGGLSGSRRDGSGALLDALTAVRKQVPTAGVLAYVARAEMAELTEACIASGADDVISDDHEALWHQRYQRALDLAIRRSTESSYEDYARTLAYLSTSVGSQLDTVESLHEYLVLLCDTIGWSRGVLLITTEDPNSLLLVAAADEPGQIKVPIALSRYPEVKACLQLSEPVLVDDTRSSDLLGSWAQTAAHHGGAALLAVPVLGRGGAIGVLLFRGARPQPVLEPRLFDFLRLSASVLALVLQQGSFLEQLREQTKRRSAEKYIEERRKRALGKFRDFFESASDGVIVVGKSGEVLYVNRAAEQITGYSGEGLSGRAMSEIVAPAQREALSRILARIIEGEVLDWFDLQLSTTSGEALTVSVSSSSALAEHAAAVLNFRDVTEARALEYELRKTKDFLERLIDSTVDGIVAVDMRGQVMVFNQGAARLYGYSPDEVIGKIPVWKLYPEGIAKTIMGELRREGPGVAGRLEPSRRDILSRTGELVPVTLAASIVYENGREIASVGVLSDLRERMKIEQRLAQAQEKLVVSEKQALIAELAGTTAHELNQPLTSIMGYSELLRKKMSPDDAHYRAVDIILREAERMAEIVRKIGRITRYETKAYVGSAQILDLDKSSRQDR